MRVRGERRGGGGGGDVDGGWAWMVLLASFFNLLVASGVGFVSGIFQKLFLDHFDHSVAFTAWVTALFNSFMQLAGPLSGLLMSATNCRVTVMVGGALLAGGLAASAFATSLHQLLLSFGLVAGLGLGLMYSPSIVIVNFFFDRRRTVIMGLALSASGLGITVTPMLSRFLIDHFSWRETMMILAAIAAHVCVFGAIMFPMHEPPSPCLRLCRPAPQSGDLDPHPSAEGNIPVDQHSVGSKEKCVLVSQSPSSIRRDSGDKSAREMGCGEKIVIEMSSGETYCLGHVLENGLNLAQGTESVDDELKFHGDVLEERTLLPENSAVAGDNQMPKQKPAGDSHTKECPPHHSQLTRLIPQPHVGSRNSLNEASHQYNRLRPSANSPPNCHQLSHSAHNLDRPPKHVHPPPPLHTSARSLLTGSGGRGTPQGTSQGDLRKLCIFSSIHSLHSGGMPTAVDLVTSSPDLHAGGEEGGGEEGGGAGGGGWRALKNVSFLFLCLNLFLSNMAISIFNIHLPAFSQQQGLDDHDIMVAVACHGVGIFVSRMLVGALGHDDRVDKLAVYFGLYLIASFLQAALPWMQSLAGVTAIALLMGVYYGGVYSLLTTLTISVVGLPSLVFAFGVEMIAAGLGYLVAPPLAGWVVDVTGDYNKSMYLGAVLMLLSALSLLCVTCGRPRGAPGVGCHPPPPPHTHLEDHHTGHLKDEDC